MQVYLAADYGRDLDHARQTMAQPYMHQIRFGILGLELQTQLTDALECLAFSWQTINKASE